MQPNKSAMVYLATSIAWSAALVRDFPQNWPFSCSTLSKLKQQGHLGEYDFVVLGADDATGRELACVIDTLGQLRRARPEMRMVVVGREMQNWEWEFREAGALDVVSQIQHSDRVVGWIRRHFEQYPLPEGNPVTSQVMQSLPWSDQLE